MRPKQYGVHENSSNEKSIPSSSDPDSAALKLQSKL
jgi:hypothetical protein